MSQFDIKELERKSGAVSEILRSLAHPTRLLILCSLAEKELRVNDLIDEIGISQSLMSQFLGRMKDEGLLKSNREGRFIYYSIKDDRVLKLLKTLRDIYCR